MTRKNKFGIAPLETKSMGVAKTRTRPPGPMGAAVREAAGSLQEATEVKLEQRKQNATDAKELRAAREEGRVLERIPLDQVDISDLPRDRMDLDGVLAADEMEELITSIRSRGQKEPAELYEGVGGQLHLKTGYRRLMALKTLYAETRDEAFGALLARVDRKASDRLGRYIDMVEENVVREDLTFAEMAQVAITAAADEGVAEQSATAMVNQLYGALHKMKRSHIRNFVQLLETFGDLLIAPKLVPRNTGTELIRALQADRIDVEDLRRRLGDCSDAETQNKVMGQVVKEDRATQKPRVAKRTPARQKFEFHVGASKVTARKGEFRIVSDTDYAGIGQEDLARAVAAFEAALKARKSG